MKDINAEEYNELLNSEAPVVIDFHATWCGPCKVLSPILEELSGEVTGVEFVKLDVDQHPEIAGANGVMGVPTVVMLKGGEVKERFVGVQPKEVIKEKVSALIWFVKVNSFPPDNFINSFFRYGLLFIFWVANTI